MEGFFCPQITQKGGDSKMKKLITMALTAVLSVSCLAGCSSGSTSSTSAGSSEQSSASASGSETAENTDLEDFDLVLDWYPNAVHAFIYDAIEKGYFAEEGLNVNILFPSNSNDAISLTAAGKADAGLYYQDDIIMAIANEDVPVKIIGSVVQEPLDLIASLSEKNITRPKDLEGKTLGYTGVAFSEAVINAMMESDGSSIDKVNLINVGFDLMSAMTTGNVDATFGCFINHEIPQLEKEGFPMSYFVPSEYGVPNYYSLVFVANKDSAEKENDKYYRFLRACSKGFYDMKTDPEGTLNILLANQNEDNFPLDPDVETESINILLPMMEKEFSPFLSQDPNCYLENINWLYDNGLLNEKIDVSEVYIDCIDQDYYMGEDEVQ